MNNNGTPNAGRYWVQILNDSTGTCDDIAVLATNHAEAVALVLTSRPLRADERCPGAYNEADAAKMADEMARYAVEVETA